MEAEIQTLDIWAFYFLFGGCSGIFKTHFKIHVVQDATAPEVLFTPYFGAEKLYLRL